MVILELQDSGSNIIATIRRIPFKYPLHYTSSPLKQQLEPSYSRPSINQTRIDTQRAEIALRFRALHWKADVITAGL